MTNTETHTSFTLHAKLSDGDSIFIDENGYYPEDAFLELEDAIYALKKVKESNFSNFKFLYINKGTFTLTLDEDGDWIDCDFAQERVFDENSDY